MRPEGELKEKHTYLIMCSQKRLLHFLQTKRQMATPLVRSKQISETRFIMMSTVSTGNFPLCPLETLILNLGDPRFATQCKDCFDFVALAICHAVTVLLEKCTDKDLQVFRIFEEYISILVSLTQISPLDRSLISRRRNNKQNLSRSSETANCTQS